MKSNRTDKEKLKEAMTAGLSAADIALEGIVEKAKAVKKKKTKKKEKDTKDAE